MILIKGFSSPFDDFFGQNIKKLSHFSGGDRWEWCSGKILFNSTLLSRSLYQSLQKNHWS